jgi:apolipoprotein N-acyltransferase
VGNLNVWHYFTAALHMPLAVRVEIVLAPAIVFAFAVLLFRALLRRGAVWSALVAFPVAWVSFEYILNLTSPHGTAGDLAYSQLKLLPLLQLASITGPWGISFTVLLFSSALAIGLYLRATAPRQALRVVAATLSVIAAVLIFGAVRLALPPPPGHAVKVGLVASDLPANVNVAAPGADTERLMREYATQVETLAADGAQVIVLPEHLGTVVDPDTSSIDAIFQPLADKTGDTIVVGLGHISAQAKYNQARVYQPSVQVASYNKHHLLPPYELIFNPGRSLLTLPEQDGKWGVAICKDMDFTPLARQYGNSAVGLLLVPGWDFQMDRLYHGHMAIMRGVESGFAIARAARGGYLTVTDNRGRIIAEAQSNSAPFATLTASVPAVHDRTIYLMLGDWFAWFALAALVFTLLRLIQLVRRGSAQ